MAGPATSGKEMAGFGRALAEDSADAAEFFANLAMERRLVHFPYGHSLERLADTLEAGDTERRWGGMVTLLRALNGDTRRHHQAMCVRIPITAEDVERAGTRLSVLLPALVVEFREAAGEPELAEAANMALAELRDSCRKVIGRFPEELPPALSGPGGIAAAAREALPGIRAAYAAIAESPELEGGPNLADDHRP